MYVAIGRALQNVGHNHALDITQKWIKEAGKMND